MRSHDITALTPVRYPRPSTVPDDEVTLTLVLVLRRVRGGSSVAAAVRDLDLSYRSVQCQLQRARARLGVRTVGDLLELPRVKRQLDGDEREAST